MVTDLAVQGLLVRIHRQEEVGPLLCELPKNGFCVWSASDWIKMRSRFMVETSSRRTARSWFSRVSSVARQSHLRAPWSHLHLGNVDEVGRRP